MTRRMAWAVLATATILVSTAGPFIEAAAMDAYVVVTWRLALAAPFFLIWGLLKGGLRPPPGEARRLVIGGVLLAVHFLLWVKAFDLTDFASNLLLLVAQPLIAAPLGATIGEKPTRETWIGLGIAAVGLAIIGAGDYALGPRALLGDALCILAGGAISLFFLITRRARATMNMPAFMGWTMGVAALAALPVALLGGAPLLDWPRESWLWLGLLVVATTMGGHGLMNLVARHVRLFTVNAVIIVEPILGILMAAWMFGETVTPLQVTGGALLGVAVVIALRPEARAGVAAA